MVLVAVQLSVMGLYLPPLKDGVGDGVGLAVAVVGRADVGVDAANCAQHLSPVLKLFEPPASPPQTIISLPVHTAV